LGTAPGGSSPASDGAEMVGWGCGPPVSQMATVMALPMKDAAWAVSSVYDGGYGG